MIQMNIHMEETHKAKRMGGGMEFPCLLQMPHSPTPPLVLQPPDFPDLHTLRIFKKASSHSHDQSLTPFPAPVPQSMRDGTESSTLLILALDQKLTQSPLIRTKTFPSPRKFQGAQELRVRNQGRDQLLKQKMPQVFLSLWKLQGFQEVCAGNGEWGGKDQYKYVFFPSSYTTQLAKFRFPCL